MLDHIYEWIQNIAFYLVMVTVLMHIIPNPDYRKYIRFFTGMVLVVMMTDPVLKVLGMGDLWQEIEINEEYQKQIQKMEEITGYLEEINPEAYLGDIWEDSEDTQDSRQNKTEISDIGVEEIKIGGD